MSLVYSKMASDPKMDFSLTLDEIMQDTSTNSDTLPDDWSSLDSNSLLKNEECQDRIVQVSVPDYEGHLISSIRAARKNEDLTDASLVVQNKTFNVHRLILSAFSNTLRVSFLKESSRVVVINDITSDIMSCILDFIYCNLAIVRENQLLNFFKAAKQLGIEHLQTPGLLKLEQNLLAQNKYLDSSSATERSSDASQSFKTSEFPKLDQSLLSLNSCPDSRSNEENSSYTKRNDLSTIKARIRSSVSVVQIDKKKASSVTISDYASEMAGKDKSKARVSDESLDKSNDEEKTHCCCCKKSGECSQEKEKEAEKEDNGENQSLMKKLKKYGTVISSSSANSLLDIPAWLFSSSDISLTPLKSPNKVSTPKDTRNLNMKTTTVVSPQSAIPDPDIIEVDSIPSKVSQTPVRKTPQNSFPNQMYQQKQAASGSSSTNRSCYAGDDIGSKRGRLPLSLRGQGRKYNSAQVHGKTPSFRQENVVNRRIVSDSSRGMPNKIQQSVSRGLHSMKQNPTAQVGTGRGRGFNRGKRNTLAGKSIYARVNKTTGASPGVPKTTVFWNGKEPIDVIDSGITVQLLDTAAEVIQNSFCLNSGAFLNTHKNLESENSQLEGSQLSENTRNSIAIYPPNPHSEVESLQSQDEHASENPQNTILAQSQEHSSTASGSLSSPANHHTIFTTEEMPRDLKGESSEANRDLPDLTKELTNKLDPDITEELTNKLDPDLKKELTNKLDPDLTKELTNKLDPDLTKELTNKLDDNSNDDRNESSTSEIAGDHGEDLSVSNTDVKPSVSNGDSIQPDNADKQDLPVKRKKARKQKKRLGRPKFDKKCSVCKKSFSSHSALIMHMRIHSEENPFHCSSCDYRSELYNSIRKHVTLKHKRPLNESEGKRHHAPVVHPSQVSENFSKKMKGDLQKQNTEIDDKSLKV